MRVLKIHRLQIAIAVLFVILLVCFFMMERERIPYLLNRRLTADVLKNIGQG